MTYPKPCAGDCNRTLRPAKSDPAAYPTADIEHHAHGLCGRCNRKRLRNPEWDPNTQHILKTRHENNIAGLTRFMARIRGKSRV